MSEVMNVGVMNVGQSYICAMDTCIIIHISGSRIWTKSDILDHACASFVSRIEDHRYASWIHAPGSRIKDRIYTHLLMCIIHTTNASGT